MNIFYNNKTLEDNLICLCEDNNSYECKQINNDIIFLNENKEIVGFNIDHFSQYLVLNNGRQFLTNDLKQIIQNHFKDYKLSEIDDGFLVAKVIKCEPIEETHLHNCEVDIKNQILNIVCGAKNVRNGLITVVATVNTIMNSGLVIKPSKLKGFASNGMLCSQKELNLEGFNNEGIIELDENKYEVGAIFKPMYKNI